MRIAHLTTVDMSLRYLLLPQLEAAQSVGEVVGISAPGGFVAELEEMGIRHIPLPASTRGVAPIDDLRAAIQLWRALRRERIEILHTHNPKPGVYGRIVGRLSGVPIVVNTIHGLYATVDSSVLQRGVVYGLEWLASRFSDAELVQNPEDFELLTRRSITPPSRTRLLGNGVDLARFNRQAALTHRDATRAELGIGEEQIVVGMVGRLVAEKGIPELISASETLDDRFVVAVAGPHDPEKADSVSPGLLRRGEQSGVRFLGMRDDVERLYGAFDLFVLPSHREGFPRAAMEAAASGLPVIATDIRGCRQIVQHGVNGLLFPRGDVQRLAESVTELGDDDDLRRQMGEASAHLALTHFDESRVVAAVMSTYREVANEKGLEWAIADVADVIRLREASLGDARSIAELHRRMISAGFLSTLGVAFLSLLYRALIPMEDSGVFVAEVDGVVVGFVAGTSDTGAFYRHFIRRHTLGAFVRLLPSLFRPSTLRRIYETLRYGSGEERATAELLSMAVAPTARRRGVGKRLVDRLIEWATGRGITAMKVVVAADNRAATELYNRCGFEDGRKIEVHQQAPSWEFLWSA